MHFGSVRVSERRHLFFALAFAELMSVRSPQCLKALRSARSLRVGRGARGAVWCHAVADDVAQICLHGSRRRRSQHREPYLDDIIFAMPCVLRKCAGDVHRVAHFLRRELLLTSVDAWLPVRVGSLSCAIAVAVTPAAAATVMKWIIHLVAFMGSP